MKIIKTILSILLSFVLFFLLLILCFFISIQNNFKISFINEVNAYEFTEDDFMQMSSMNEQQLHQLLDEKLAENDIPIEIIDYVANHEEYESLIEEYKNTYMDYLTGKSEKPEMDTQKIDKILEESITAYNNENEEKIDINKVDEISNFVATETNNIIDKIDENKEVKTVIFFLFNQNYPIYIMICVISCSILLFLLKRKKALLYIAIPLLCSSFILIASSLFFESNVFLQIKQILGNIYTSFCHQVQKISFLYFICSILCIIIYQLTKKKVGKSQ